MYVGCVVIQELPSQDWWSSVAYVAVVNATTWSAYRALHVQLLSRGWVQNSSEFEEG